MPFPTFKTRILHDLPVPGNETGLRFGLPLVASWPSPAAWLLFWPPAPVRAEDANPVLAKVNGVEIRQSDLTMAEEELGQPRADGPRDQEDNVLSFLIDLKDRRQGRRGQEDRELRGFKKRLAFTRTAS